MATLTSKLIVELVDRATAPARAIAAGINRLTAMQTRNAAALATTQTQMIGAIGAFYGLTRAIGAPVKAATDFETKLEDIAQKIEAPRAELPKLGAELRAVAAATTQTASKMAEGMDVLAGMGAKREDALGLLPAIGRAATAYNAEVKDLAQAGYAALDNLKVPANQFAAALDAMSKSGKEGAFELRDMAQYFPSLGAGYQALKQSGVPAVADLAAALQIVRKGAGDSSEAATNLNNILQKINAPLTRKNFEKMGIDLEKEMARAAKAGATPIEAIAVLTNKVLKGNLARLGDLFEDAQVQKGLRPLIQNIKEYRRIRKEALAAQGVVEEDYRRRLQTSASAIQRFRIAVENINLAVGGALLPGLTVLADAIVPLANRFAAFAEKHPAVTRAIVATSAALIGLRIAGIAAKFALLWMWGGALAIAKGALLGLAGAVRLASLAMLPFGAALRAGRSAIVGFAATAAILGSGGALRMAAVALLGLLNPLRLVTVALRLLKFALIGTGIGAVLIGIAMAGLWIYNNWSGLTEMFTRFGAAFMAAIAPVRPVLEPVIGTVSAIYDWFNRLLGPVEGLGAAGERAGRALGEALVSAIQTGQRAFDWLTGLPRQIGDAFQSALDAVQAKGEALGTILDGWRSKIIGTFSGIDLTAIGTQIMTSLLNGVKAGAKAVLDFFTGIGSKIKSAISGAASGARISVPTAPAPALAGARAAGGPVRRGLSYLVGENGPEIFTANATGMIQNTNRTVQALRAAALASAVAVSPAAAQGGGARAGGGQTMQVDVGGIHIHAQPGQSPEQIADAVERRLSAKLGALSRGAYSDGVY